MMQRQQQHDEESGSVRIRHTVVSTQEEHESDLVVEATEQTDVQASERVKGALQHEVFRRKRRERMGLGWMAVLLLPPAAGFCAGRLTEWGSWFVSHPIYLVFYYLLLLLPLPLVLGLQGRRRIARHAGAVADFDDLSLVGPLTETLKFEDRKIRAHASAALIRLLPRMQATDAHLLNGRQRAMLCRILAQPLNDLFRTDVIMLVTRQTHHVATFQAAILQAFEQVGDARALPIVEQLANRPAKTVDQQRVRAAAQECLPYLQLRVEQERAHQTLLRASSAAATDPDILLRPATAGGTTDAEQLLRPDPDLPAASHPFAPFRESAKRLYAVALHLMTANA